MEINQVDKSFDKICKTLEQNYKKAPFFNLYYEKFSGILYESGPNLSNINIRLIKWICGLLGIETGFIISSQMEGLEGNSTDRLVSVCRKMDGEVYFSGFGGSNYQEEQKFKENGITLKVTDFNHPVYNQLWGDFEPNLSIIDLLFNEGENAKHFINI